MFLAAFDAVTVAFLTTRPLGSFTEMSNSAVAADCATALPLISMIAIDTSHTFINRVIVPPFTRLTNLETADADLCSPDFLLSGSCNTSVNADNDAGFYNRSYSKASKALI